MSASKYERNLFTVRNKLFKQDNFVDGVNRKQKWKCIY